ncbi:MAG: type II toxin-antitoxin system death-on-curing family toxin [Kiloniellales bacterium]|nr:type II toxin-antitoxin system death-on-curing family toxin [Kiloniellales bacterium]
MPSEPRWITLENLILINAQRVAETGEPHQLLDEGLLESAVTRPQNRWGMSGERDVVRLATTLLYGVAKNHAFEQGNKRTATVAALVFLEANGYCWTLQDDEELAEWVLALVRNELSEEALAELMRPYVQSDSD